MQPQRQMPPSNGTESVAIMLGMMLIVVFGAAGIVFGVVGWKASLGVLGIGFALTFLATLIGGRARVKSPKKYLDAGEME